MAFMDHLCLVARHNIRTLKTSPWAEVSGCLGDIGTLLPLMIAMALKGSIDLPATLVFSGLTNIITGAVYGIPLPVQPMKAIAAIAISQNLSKEETAAAGLTMGIAVMSLSATGLLKWLNRVVPTPVVKGIQVGAGLALAISAGTTLILPLQWSSPLYDNRLWAVAAFLLLVVTALVPKVPYALLVFTFGLIVVATIPASSSPTTPQGAAFWHPSIVVPSRHAWRVGAIDAAIPQLPLTTLNSILAVTSLASTLFPDFPPTPSTTSIGFSVAITNLIGCWWGAMPICHGSGGLAGQYRFGARSGASIIILGTVKLLLGLFVGNAILPVLQYFPKSLLGVMVLAAGVELAKVGQSVLEKDALHKPAFGGEQDGENMNLSASVIEERGKDAWMVMLITAAGCLAFRNDAVGFLAGLIWHWSSRLPPWMEIIHRGRRSIKLGDDVRAEETSGVNDRPS